MRRGTSPFFGGRTCFAKKRWPTTWTCPLPCRGGDSPIFAATTSVRHCQVRRAAKIGTVPGRSLFGFTLLEVLLAISLTAMVLVAVSMAIDFHLRVLGSGRADVEEAQLARAVLQRIATDLRSAVPPSDASAGGYSGVSSGVSAGGQGGVSGGSSISQRESSDTSVVEQTTPGLYGTAAWLQLDISRLPRLDQFVPNAGAAVSDRASEIKTVAYYVIQPQSDGTGGGLVRRELDRAVTSWAATQGNLADFETDVAPFAPEVATVQFQYFDGTDMVNYWDMEERNGLPMAVEIILQLRPKNEKARPMLYRLVVDLPIATPTTVQTSETGTSSETKSTSGSTSGGKTP